MMAFPGAGTGDEPEGRDAMENHRMFLSGMKARGLGLALAVVGMAVAAPYAIAEDVGPQARAVRLSFVEGQVEVSQGGTVLAPQALANTPLFEGTEISTQDDGRA